MDRMLVECLIDAKLGRIRTNLKEELKLLPWDSSNPHATAARVAVNAMILAIKTELDR